MSGHKEEDSGGRRAEDGAWERTFPSSGRREKHPRRMLSQMRGDSAWRVYVTSFYFCSYTLTSVGYGDLGPKNILERAFCTGMVLTAGICWAYILGQVCAIVTDITEDAERTGSGGYLILWSHPSARPKEAVVATLPDELFDWLDQGVQKIAQLEMLMIAHALIKSAGRSGVIAQALKAKVHSFEGNNDQIKAI
ncbi:unnamed protein product [Cladocopium goreaui]|uniref:Potassium voltage-gated channel subfamily H member 1 (Ether-a-go-go potassium channel 1) (EAG channel 1) (BEAG) (Voltage-gated potassium channel subunit Kv10.1) n=1 Tax=Cladocopium goreaui TaxID=2562237 RepID=A0A9P1DQX9_9DINO|nr:unnamed protein product [Cladocopium goreaui]